MDDAKEGPAEAKPTLKERLAESRQIFVTIFLFTAFLSVSEMVTPPHLRTFVPCDSQGGGAGRGETFSGSRYCDDKKLVVQTVTQIAARNQAIMGAVAVVASPVLGALSDRRGRLPVLYVSVLGRLVILLILSFHSGYFMLLSVSAVISGGTTMFNAIWNMMLGDKGGDRSVAFTLKMMVGQAGAGLGLVVGVGLLRLELLDYTYVFLAFIGLYLLFAASALSLPETLPAKSSAADAASDPGPDKIINLETIFGTPLLLMRDPALAYLLCAELLGSIAGSVLFNTMPSFAMTAYDWRQGIFEMVTPCLTMPPAVLAVFAPKMINKFGTEQFLKWTGAVCCFAMTLVIFAPLGPVFGLAPLAILAGTSGRYTALNTFYAERYRDDCGKIQSASQTLGQISIAAGGALTGLTYNAKATTKVAQSAPFIVVAVMVWTSSIFFSRAMHLQRQGAAAAGGDAAGDGGKKEQ